MMSGQTVSIKSKDGQTFSGYLVRPERPNGAGIVLIQEIFGVNSHVRDVADLYAADGFTVLAPDLFWRIQRNFEAGYSADDIQTGIGIMQKMDAESALADLTSTAEALRTDFGARLVGCVGYCMGGMYAYRLACRNVVSAAVSYYGGGIDQLLQEAGKINTPLLMHFALQDSYIPPASIEKITAAVANNPHVKIYTYEAVDHGFNCDQRGSYNRKAAMLAFARSTWFFHSHLNA